MKESEPGKTGAAEESANQAPPGKDRSSDELSIEELAKVSGGRVIGGGIAALGATNGPRWAGPAPSFKKG